MATMSVHERALDELQAELQGPLLRPGDASYDAATANWNGLIRRQPGGIARCVDAADVVACVRAARMHDMPLAVRSTGHDYAGNSSCDGGLVVDVSGMTDVHVDSLRRRARVQPGVTWGVLDRATQAHGLATTGGTVSSVGVTGFTLGGGSGHLMRRFGLGLDNLVSARVVTAACEEVSASEDENADLFWALRGAGANFGIVTELEFALHAVGPEVTAGEIMHPVENAREALQFYDTFMADAPPELQCYAFLLTLPPLDFLPAQYHGRTVLDLVVAFTGEPSRADEVLEPLRAFGEPFLDSVQTKTYVDMQQMFDAGMPAGQRRYSKAHYLTALGDRALDTLLSFVDPMPGAYTVAYLEPLGGAVAEVAADATAFPHRDAAYGIHIFPGWTDPAADAEPIAWARSFHEAMGPYATGGVYVNMLPHDADEDDVRSAYGANYDRLARMKRTWDPANLFRTNHNIRPAR